MTEEQVNILQGNIQGPGRVYWENGNWTSKLWQDMSKAGCRSTTNELGIVTLYDAQGQPMVSGAIGWANALIDLARLCQTERETK